MSAPGARLRALAAERDQAHVAQRAKALAAWAAAQGPWVDRLAARLGLSVQVEAWETSPHMARLRVTCDGVTVWVGPAFAWPVAPRRLDLEAAYDTIDSDAERSLLQAAAEAAP